MSQNLVLLLNATIPIIKFAKLNRKLKYAGQFLYFIIDNSQEFSDDNSF